MEFSAATCRCHGLAQAFGLTVVPLVGGGARLVRAMFSSMWKLRFGLPYMRKTCVGIVSCPEL